MWASQPNHWIKRWFCKPPRWPSAYGSPCGPRHGSVLANQLMQSAQAWLRRNNRRPLGPALTPAGSARRDGRRQGIGNVWDVGAAVGGGNAAGIDTDLGKS